MVVIDPHAETNRASRSSLAMSVPRLRHLAGARAAGTGPVGGRGASGGQGGDAGDGRAGGARQSASRVGPPSLEGVELGRVVHVDLAARAADRAVHELLALVRRAERAGLGGHQRVAVVVLELRAALAGAAALTAGGLSAAADGAAGGGLATGAGGSTRHDLAAGAGAAAGRGDAAGPDGAAGHD